MIYLVGIRHSIQFKPNNNYPSVLKKYNRFRSFIINAITENSIEVIAEEMNVEVETCKKRKSIARLIAEQNTPALIYIPCEPQTKERVVLGIPSEDEIFNLCSNNIDELEQCIKSNTKKYFPLRENFWIERLLESNAGSVLFLCGSDHIKSFSSLLAEKEIPWKILAPDWYASDDQLYGRIPLEERPI